MSNITYEGTYRHTLNQITKYFYLSELFAFRASGKLLSRVLWKTQHEQIQSLLSFTGLQPKYIMIPFSLMPEEGKYYCCQKIR